jgi:hypothetical protein
MPCLSLWSGPPAPLRRRVICGRHQAFAFVSIKPPHVASVLLPVSASAVLVFSQADRAIRQSVRARLTVALTRSLISNLGEGLQGSYKWLESHPWAPVGSVLNQYGKGNRKKRKHMSSHWAETQSVENGVSESPKVLPEQSRDRHGGP